MSTAKSTTPRTRRPTPKEVLADKLAPAADKEKAAADKAAADKAAADKAAADKAAADKAPAQVALQQGALLEAQRREFTADLSARLNAQIDLLASERGVSRDEIVAFAREFLGTKSTNTTAPETGNGGGGDPAAPAATGGAQRATEEALIRVLVTGPKDGRWRAGHQFTEEARLVDVTADQLEALRADPKLKVVERG